MPNNISSGLNFVVAATTKLWGEIPLTPADTLEVYASNDGNPVSWRPGRSINTLSGDGIEEGRSYMLNSLVERDLTATFSPPISFVNVWDDTKVWDDGD